MEKRLLLAFALSFAVLVIWGRFFPAPKPAENKSQIAVNKEVKTAPAKTSHTELLQAAPSSPKKEPIHEKTITLENGDIVAKFSNIGGVLKSLYLKHYKVSLPVTDIGAIKGYGKDEFSGAANGREIRFSYENKNIAIEKTYRFLDNAYLMQSDIKIQNKKQAPENLSLDIVGFRLDISKLDDDEEGHRDRSLLEYSVSDSGHVMRRNNAFEFSEKKDNKEKSGNVRWVAFRDKYFAFIYKPTYTTEGYQTVFIDKKNIAMQVKTASTEIGGGGSADMNAVMYFGPQKLSVMASYKEGFDEVMRFSNWGFLDVVAKGIYKLMHLIHRWVPSWGWTIVILAVLINGALYPLTLKSMMTMKDNQRRMQELQPKLNQLKEKYKNNPQKLNKETGEIFKEHNINPLGGCWPFFLQFPVFIGLYQVLWRSVSLRGASFLWIKDLSQPDRLFLLPVSFPFIGNEVNLLPIIMGVLMFVQQKLSAKNMVTADPNQAAQQKMMAIFFPFLMIFFFYKAASGLTMYFVILYMFTSFTQWKMSKLTKAA